MQINANLAGGIDSWALRAAGLEVQGWSECAMGTLDGDVALPRMFKGRYLPDEKVTVSVTLLQFGGHDDIDRWRDKSGKIAFKRVAKAKQPTIVQIDVDDAKAARAIAKALDLYSYENDGELAWWRGHSETWAKIDKVMARDGLTHETLGRGKGTMSRSSVEALMELCAKLEDGRRENVYGLFTNRNVASKDWAIAVGWLIKEFERDLMLDDQLSTRIYELTVPAIAEDLIRFIKDKRYGDERWPLCLALAKTKHAKAADTIVTVLGQSVNTRGALEALAKLPARAHIETIKKYLRDADSDVRRQAKKTLAKLGVAEDAPPPAPVHLVKGRKGVPRGLEEWSANLDMDELRPVLEKLAKRIDHGFGKSEIAEVIGVAEQMRVDQTRAFRFPISADGEKSDVWIVIFMDDIDSPDVEIHAGARIVQKLA